MSKRLLNDMVRVKRPERKRAEVREKFDLEVTSEPEKIEINPKDSKGKQRSRFLLWFVAAISMLICFFAVSFLFAKAQITVTPKTEDVVLNENLSASKDTNAGNGLLFDLVVIPGNVSKNLEASTEKDIKIAATGTAIIYNAYNSSPQTLAIDTRLQGSNGKIYKTQNKVVVPGMGKNSTPGSVEVKIYGNEPGPDYNGSNIDFQIIGFKGTAKYSKFYGRSTGDITGGFIGKGPDVSDSDKAAALSDLKNSLQDKLLQNAVAQIPAGFVLFKNAIFLDTGDPSISYNEDNSMTLSLEGTLYGFIFNENKLTQKIVTDVIDNYDGSDVYISNLKNLNFVLENKDSASFDTTNNISFNLSGSAKIVWKLDVNKFTNDLLGVSKKSFNSTLSQYPNINSAILKISPIWKTTIPDKAKNVKVIVNYPN